MSEALRYANAYLRRGWPVFPCRPDKTPATRNGFKDATLDPEKVAHWFGSDDPPNIGIACGDRLAVIDIDPRHDDRGMPLDALLADLGPLPADAPRVATGGGGVHIYHAGPHRTDPRLGGREWAEIRGQGAYVIAPPSIHANGRLYAFTVMPSGPLPALPARLRQSTRPAARPVEHYQQLASSTVAAGGRHNAVLSLIGHLLRRDVDPRVAWPLVESWNQTHCKPPLPDRQVERAFIDLCERERQRRGRAS